MNRRDLVVLTGGLAVASPAARAQTRTSPRRIGLLLQRDSLFDLPRWRSAMAERGLVEGTAYVVEVKSAGGRAGVLDGLADDLVRARVDLIVAVQTPAAVAAKRATRDIPIVALTGDPVGTGLVASHARPGGNVTGIDSSSAEIGGKWVELLRELLPACRRVGVMANPPDPFAAPFIEGTRRAGAGIGVEIEVFPADNPTTLDATIDAMLAAKTDAAIVQPSLSVARIAALTRDRGLPAISQPRVFVAAGGLLAYGRSDAEYYRLTAYYSNRILKGANPAELPVQRQSRFDLLINAGTAKRLGIAIPPLLLARAEEVIE